MKLTLVEPSLERADQFLSLVEELRGVGQPLAGTEGLDHDAMTDYVAQLSRLKAGVGLESWQVPMSTFWLIDEARGLVGLSRIRHRLTPTLRLEIEAVSTESGKLIRRYWIDLP